MSYGFQESYTPTVLPVTTSSIISCARVAGFLCTTAGTLTITPNGKSAWPALAVTAGVYYPLPFQLSDGIKNHTFATAGGAGGGRH